MDDYADLKSLAVRMARATPLLLREDNDWGPFYEVLDDLLELTPEDEMFVVQSVAEYFRRLSKSTK